MTPHPMAPQSASAASTCQARESYWRLVADGEPYRLLFPVGVAIGLYGILMWPLYIWHLVPDYPGQSHARIMIEGFSTAFVIGFLGTALPRLLAVPKVTIFESLGFAAAVIGIAWLHATGRIFWGDQLFFATMLTLVCLLGVRAVLFRRDNPPPAFLLVGLGLVCALFGSFSLSLASIAPEAIPGWVQQLGRLCLLQGYLIFPIMGIGAFLLPRFFGLPSRQDFPESLSLPDGWLARAAFAMACGGLVMAGFVLESFGYVALGNALRGGGILVYFFREVPIHQAGFGGGSLAFGLRFALISIPTAYFAISLWPGYASALLHILYITGFSLLTLIVATRVVWGHSGQAARVRSSNWVILTLIALIALAMLTRVSADWMPDIRLGHYAYAAVAWALGVVLWAVLILPDVRRSEESKSATS